MFKYLIIYKLIFGLLGSFTFPSSDHCHDHHDFTEEFSCLECDNSQVNIFIDSSNKQTYSCNHTVALFFDECVFKNTILCKNFSSRAPPAL